MVNKKEAKDCLCLFNLMSKASPDEMETILRSLNQHGRSNVYKGISNSIYNPGVSEFKKNEIRKKLMNEGKTLKYLAGKRGNEKRKKKVLIQKGGALLPLILSAAIPLLSSLLGGK